MNNFLAWLGALLVAVLAALFAVPAMIDWNGYRGVFEEEATRVLGRDVRLGGNVNLRLLPAPYVSFEKLRISDPGSQTGEPLFHADSFTMWLAISPLLRGVLQANQVELVKPVVKLAVNDKGEGNWSTLELTPGSLPFVPADVMLNSVKLTNGEIGFVGPRGNELGRLEAVNGEFAADAIRGPYRFRGRLDWAGEARDVRLTTGVPEANGDMRFKVAIIGAASHSSYVLDGRVADLSGKPRVTGELAAKFAPKLAPAEDKPAAAPSPPAKAAAEPPPVTINPVPGRVEPNEVPLPAAAKAGDVPLYDLRSKVEADTEGFQLAEINVTSDGGGPPQVVTGDARFGWAEKTMLDLTLNSRWLDLDALFGKRQTSAPVVPLEAARELFDTLMRALPSAADANVTLAVDQLNLGADQISDVRIAAVRAGGPLELREFRVGLPGQTQLSLSGKLAPGEFTPKFEGAIGLKGQNLGRFLAWGLKQQDVIEGRSDGTFALNGKLKFSGKLIELSDANVGVGDVPVTANVRLDMGDRRRLAVNLEGQKIDVGRLWPGRLQVGTLAPLLSQTRASTGSEASSAERWFDPANGDVQFGIKAGSLVDGDRKLRDVEVDVSVERGKLAIRSLKFGSDEGLAVELQGETAGADAAGQGIVRGLISAPDAQSVQSFVGLAGLATFAPDLAQRLETLAPLRLAGTVRLGARGGQTADVDLDGVVRGGGRLVGNFELDGGVEGWRSAPVHMTLRVDTPDVDQSLAALLDDPSQAAATGTRSGRILARATGTPQTGLFAFAAVESEGMTVDYTGKATLAPSAPLALDGDLKVAGRDMRALLALAGLKLPAGAAGVPALGRLALVKSGTDITLKPSQFAVAGTPLAGEIKISQQDSGRRVLSGDLQAGEVTLPGLLSAVLDRAAETPTAAQAGEAPTEQALPSLWPDQGFDFSALGDVEGQVTLRASRFSVEPGLAIADAKLDVTLSPGRVAVTSLEGDALGGKANASLTLEKAPAGVSLDGGLKIVVPADTGASAAPEATPEVADLQLKFNGRALSPAAMMADLKGAGELKLGEVSLGGMSPAGVGKVSEAAMTAKGPQSGEPLTAAVREGLKQGELPLGSVSVPITIGDGSLKFARIQLDRPEGRTTFETVVELSSLKIDSEWNIEARLPKSAGRVSEKLLPPVSIVYTGKLKDIATIEPSISAVALERELTVRKMERDVEQLEKLRMEDEQRAKEVQARLKAEQERVKAERERAAAAAAAAAAVDDPQPDPVPGVDATVDQEQLPPVNDAKASGTSPRQNSPPKRRKPPEKSWNPFTPF